MKKLSIVLIFSISLFNSFANEAPSKSTQTICSTATSGAFYTETNGEISVIVSVAVKDENGDVAYTYTQVPDAEVSVASSQALESFSGNTCEQSEEAKGVTYVDTVTYKKLLITAKDGAALPENVIGLNAEGKLPVRMLCESYEEESLDC